MVGIGPLDLSQALGYPDQIDHPVVQKAIADILDRVSRSGKVAGITAKDAASARKCYDMGARYFWANASSLLACAGKSCLESVRALAR